MESTLEKIARNTLTCNIIHVEDKNYIVAGANQFKTFWTRDFCYSVKGLLASGHVALVKDQLQLIYQYRDRNNQLPRGLDVMAPQRRVVINLLSPSWFDLTYPTEKKVFNKRLKAEYLGEHGTIPFDSNVLFVQAYLDYVQASGDDFLSLTEIETMLLVYRNFYQEELFWQPKYSDWQDSVKRQEPMLLFHVQLLSVLNQLKFEFHFEVEFFKDLNLEKTILAHFYEETSGLFYQDINKTRTALDAYGVIFSRKLFKVQDVKRIYQAINQHDLWRRSFIPGLPVSKNYEVRQVSWTTKLVGLRHYHDNLHWGWLIAEAYKIAKIMQDEKETTRIIELFFKSFKQSTFLSEVYLEKNNELQVFQNRLYKSEGPFTWSAAKWLEALKAGSLN